MCVEIDKKLKHKDYYNDSEPQAKISENEGEVGPGIAG